MTTLLAQDVKAGPAKINHTFKVATLPAIVLLKLVAYDDRPEKRMKDARDIANVINHYFSLMADVIYKHHNDLFLVDEEKLNTQSLQEIAAIVIGREIKKITDGNEPLQERLKGILRKPIQNSH